MPSELVPPRLASVAAPRAGGQPRGGFCPVCANITKQMLELECRAAGQGRAINESEAAVFHQLMLTRHAGAGRWDCEALREFVQNIPRPA